MDIRFDNKVVLITGASTGIGAATALEFARAGAAVMINYNSSESAAKNVLRTIEQEGGKGAVFKADVTRQTEVEGLVEKTLGRFGGRIDILINNAGSLLDRRHFSEMTDDLWDRTMELNVRSVYLCCKRVVPVMKKQAYGKIINISSIAARNGGSIGAGHYSSAKAAVLTFSKNLAKELAGHNITVNNITPGIISTPFHDRFTSNEMRKRMQEAVPLGREGTPEEVAWPILFMASDYASYITGETLEVNGGLLMD